MPALRSGSDAKSGKRVGVSRLSAGQPIPKYKGENKSGIYKCRSRGQPRVRRLGQRTTANDCRELGIQLAEQHHCRAEIEALFLQPKVPRL